MFRVAWKMLTGDTAKFLGLVVGVAFASCLMAQQVSVVFARTFDIRAESLVLFVIGGILGAIIAAMIMDWAIIALSSLVGAATIVDQFALDASIATLLFIAIATIGIIVQGRRLRPVTTGP